MLYVDAKEEIALQMFMEGSDMTARPVMEKVIWKLNVTPTILEQGFATSNGLVVRNEYVFPFAEIRELKIEGHSGS